MSNHLKRRNEIHYPRVVIARSNGVDPDSRVEKEANSLAKRGYEVTILAWDRSDDYVIREDVKKLADTEVRRVSFGAKAEFGAGMKSLVPFVKFQLRLFKWLVKNHNQYDIAHFCDFDTAFIGRKAARLYKKKVVFDLFDYNGSDAKGGLQKLAKKAEDAIINHSDATIICTEERREQIAETKPYKLVIIHNTPQITRDGENDRRDDKAPVRIVYVGILQDSRLLDEVLHAMKNLNGVELHIGGFGKYEDNVKQAANSCSNIIYYGKLPYDKTISLESSCDIMTAVYDPSIVNHQYAAPNKFYEALMLGKPLIMVKGTGMSRIVENEDIGVLIDYSEEGFVKGVKELIQRKKEWTDMSQRMKSLYKKAYSWDEMEKRLYALYDDLCDD